MTHLKTLAHRAEKYLAANEAAKGNYRDSTYARLEKLELAAYETEAKTIADVAAFLKLLKDFFDTTGVNDRMLETPICERIDECIRIAESARNNQITKSSSIREVKKNEQII